MNRWLTGYTHIITKQDVSAFKTFPFAQRNTNIKIQSRCLEDTDAAAVCFRGLKGLHFVNQEETEMVVGIAFFNEIVQSRSLELIHLEFDEDCLLPFQKLTLGSSVTNTLRFLGIYKSHLEDKELDLIGRSLQFNSVLEKLALGGIALERCAKVLMYIAESNIRDAEGFQLNEVAFYCASVVLSKSKISSIKIENWTVQEPRKWWRYLIGVVEKPQRKILLDNTDYEELFSAKEKSLFYSL